MHQVLEETIQHVDVILMTECTPNQWHLYNFYHTKELSFKEERMPKHLQDDPVNLSATYNSLKHFSVFTFFSLAHPHDQQSFYSKTNVPAMGARRKAEEQDKCHPFVWANLRAWDHNTVMRESRGGERHQEDTQGRGGLVPGLSLNTVRQNFCNTALSSLIYQGAAKMSEIICISSILLTAPNRLSQP